MAEMEEMWIKRKEEKVGVRKEEGMNSNEEDTGLELNFI